MRFAIPWSWRIPLHRRMAVTMRLWFPRTALKRLWYPEMAWAREFNDGAVTWCEVSGEEEKWEMSLVEEQWKEPKLCLPIPVFNKLHKLLLDFKEECKYQDIPNN